MKSYLLTGTGLAAALAIAAPVWAQAPSTQNPSATAPSSAAPYSQSPSTTGSTPYSPLNTIDDEPDAVIDFPNGALCAASANAIVIFSGDFFIRAIRNERECRRAEDRPARSP